MQYRTEFKESVQQIIDRQLEIFYARYTYNVLCLQYCAENTPIQRTIYQKLERSIKSLCRIYQDELQVLLKDFYISFMKENPKCYVDDLYETVLKRLPVLYDFRHNLLHLRNIESRISASQSIVCDVFEKMKIPVLTVKNLTEIKQVSGLLFNKILESIDIVSEDVIISPENLFFLSVCCWHQIISLLSVPQDVRLRIGIRVFQLLQQYFYGKS